MATLLKTWTDKQLIARPCEPTVARAARIKAGAGVLAKGQVLGRISASPNQLAVYNNANSNGTETAVAILLEDTDASGSDDVMAMVLIEGVVFESALVSLDSAAKTDLQAKYPCAGELLIRGGY